MIDSIFTHIVKMSFTASIVIAVVLVARLFLNKAPKVFSYALWSVVLIRLICPFSIKSILSLIPQKANNISQQIVTSNTPNTVVSAPPIINAPQMNVDPPTQVIVTKSINWLFVIEILWLVGILALITYSIISFIKLKKSLKYSLNYRDNIYLAQGLKSPFVMGIFSPKIYLPSNLTQEEKGYIILHEQMHIKRFDHIIKIISFLCLSMHWFNPLVWIAFFISGKDMEMSCDESVIKKLGNNVKKDYSTSLLSLATGKRIIGGTPLAFGEGQTKSRIKNILSYKKPRFWVALVCVLTVITVCVGLMTNPKEKETIFNNDSLVNAEIIDIDSEHKTLMIKGIEKADENSLSGDRCYLSCDEATIYKDNEEVDFSRLKIGNKIACEITEVLESYPTQADTKIIKITDDNFTEPLFKVDTSMLNSLDSLENVSAFAFTEYTKYLNSQKEDEVDKEDFNLTSKKLISGDIRDFVYEYEYTHTRPIDSSLPKQSKVQLHIVNINGNGIQYYVMSADGDIENELNDESQTNITQYTDSEILCEDYLKDYFLCSYKENNNFDPTKYISDINMLEYVQLKYEIDRNNLNRTNLENININKITDKHIKEDGTICLLMPYEISYGQDSAYGRSAYFEVQKQQTESYKITKVCDFDTIDCQSFNKDFFNCECPMELNIKAGIDNLKDMTVTSNAETDVITKTKDSYTITFPAYQEVNKIITHLYMNIPRLM